MALASPESVSEHLDVLFPKLIEVTRMWLSTLIVLPSVFNHVDFSAMIIYKSFCFVEDAYNYVAEVFITNVHIITKYYDTTFIMHAAM